MSRKIIQKKLVPRICRCLRKDPLAVVSHVQLFLVGIVPFGMKGQTETYPSPSKCMLVSLHSGSTIPIEQLLLRVRKIKQLNKSNNPINLY